MATELDCPKRMVFGPCGGVRPDGQCEMRPGACAFDETVAWSGNHVVSQHIRAPLVLTDFSCTPFDRNDVASTAALLSPGCDAVLVGEHQNKPDFPPTLMGSLLLDAGVTPWITLSCRDRNRVVLEQELRGLRSVGVDTVLCVTGDGRGYDVRPEVTQTFDLDGLRLVSLAASFGMVAAAPETPTAPPVHARPGRLLQKQLAGASLAALNHVPFPDMTADFMKSARGEGLSIPVIAAVAVFTDSVSAAVLQGLPGLELDLNASPMALTAMARLACRRSPASSTRVSRGKLVAGSRTPLIRCIPLRMPAAGGIAKTRWAARNSIGLSQTVPRSPAHGRIAPRRC